MFLWLLYHGIGFFLDHLLLDFDHICAEEHSALLDLLLDDGLWLLDDFGRCLVELGEDVVELICFIYILHVILILPLLNNLGLAKAIDFLELLLCVLLFLFFHLSIVLFDSLLVGLLEVHRVLSVDQDSIALVQLLVRVIRRHDRIGTSMLVV